MITLPTDLTPHQLRQIDEAIHKALRPEQVVEWRWCIEDAWGDWLVFDKSISPERVLMPTVEIDGRSHILRRYHLPGAANDEVVNALMVHEKGYRDIHLAYERLLDGRDYLRADCGVWGGIASTLPCAYLACAMDAWGIGIPEAQP